MSSYSNNEQEKPHRKLFLVDIENLVGSGLIYEEEVSQARAALFSLVTPKNKDCVFVAANPMNREAVFEGWPGALYNFKYGQDGADLQIIKFFAGIEDLSKYSEVVLASGDAGLIPIARKAREMGMKIQVVANRTSCSKKYSEYSVLNLMEKQ
jgi:hypothetical protein